MKVLCIFDWENLKFADFGRSMKVLMSGFFNSNGFFVLVVNEKKINVHSFEELCEKVISMPYAGMIEGYFDVSKIDDPEQFWRGYFSISIIGKAKTFILAFNHAALSCQLFISFIRQLSQGGSLGYGFLHEFSNRVDGRYACVGISSNNSSEKEKDKNQRWMLERIKMRGESHAKNRHLKGMFKGVYELNILGIKHVENLKTLYPEGKLNKEIQSLGYDTYLWKPTQSNIYNIEDKLDQCKLII